MSTSTRVPTRFIDRWNIEGRLTVLPHIEFSEPFSTDKLLEMAEGIKKLFEDEVEVKIFERGPLCEVDGPWCVCLRFDFPPTEEEKKKKAELGWWYELPEHWYMLRRDKGWGKSYGCPMYDRERMRPVGGVTCAPDDDPWDVSYYRERLHHPDVFFKLEKHLISLGGTKVYKFPAG